MVNPPGATQVAECSCKDNWSLYSQGTCGEPICDGGSSVATLKSKPVCSNASSQPIAHNPGKFFHYSADVGSHNALCRILEGFSKSDELTNDGRSWSPVAPNGFSEFLRPDARKAFVVISDDDVNCNFGSNSFFDNDSVVSGQAVATSFDAALRNLSTEQFGTATDRNYVFHSIVGMRDNSPGADPWPASAAIQTSRCSPGSVSPGTGYQALSVLTGGLRYPSCRNDDFDAIFKALAEDVVEGAVASCSIALDANESADPDKTIVTYVPGDGSASVNLIRVSDVGLCIAKAFFYEDDFTVSLCLTTCAVVQADLSGTLGVEIGCVAGETYTARKK